jgi:hypothetical protein
MDSIAIIFIFFVGMIAGQQITFYVLLSVLHKKWYGTYIIKTKNLPFTSMLKLNLGLDREYVIK